MNEELTLSLAVAFIWYTMSGIVAVRIKRVVSAIDNHLPHKQKKKNHLFLHNYQNFKKPKLRKKQETNQLVPVVEWTASIKYCSAATGGYESAAAAATSPGNGSGTSEAVVTVSMAAGSIRTSSLMNPISFESPTAALDGDDE